MMRVQFFLIAVLAGIPVTWWGRSCEAQEAKPEKPLIDKTLLNDVAPARAIPLMRLAPATFGAPPNTTGLPFSLSNLVLAKFDDSPKGPQLIALMEQTRIEKRTVNVTRIQQEVRTRTVKVTGADGKEKTEEQQYTVAVPITEEREQAVQVPAGKKPITFPLGDLRIYRLDGTKVDETNARKLLEKMSPIFLLQGFTGDIKPVEGVFLQALNPNCLIVVTEK